MILYFSGTGNSRYVAERIAAALGDGLLCMNDCIREGRPPTVPSCERLVIVTPTYAWRIPRIVRNCLAEADLPCRAQTWFVMTCGSEIGNAAAYNRDLCREKQLACMGTAQIVMPENYIAMFHAPQPEKARRIVAGAEPDIDRAISAIAAKQAFPPPRRNLYDRFMSGPVNPIFYRFFVKAKAFASGGTCIGCGQCARLCPMNNITMQAGRPVWGGSCTHCMACICRCPAEAIEYGKKSLGEPRYHFEAL